jgi:L-threonylcarbamoyladenylate synthase
MSLQSNIEIAARMIQEGKVVAFPTETVYGLGGNALNPMAVARIFELKERPSFDPLIVHIADIQQLQRLMAGSDERVYQLAEMFWPGPLTIVVPKSDLVPDIVTSGLPTVGIRMPDNEVALELILKSGFPIAGPSANKFGRVSPTSSHHVRKQLPDVDFILDGGKTQVGIESTIITLNDKGFEILRHGLITREQIEAIIPYYNSEKQSDSIIAPGMLKSHYSPNKPLYFLNDSIVSSLDPSKGGLMLFSSVVSGSYRQIICMSENQDLKEYAVNLFDAIHSFEESDVEYMVAEPVAEQGIGLAIMDRLRKAAFQYRGEIY